jgi:hypothetical protein
MMLEGSGAGWVVRDVAAGHSAQISAAEELVGVVLGLVRGFEMLG